MLYRVLLKEKCGGVTARSRTPERRFTSELCDYSHVN